MAETYLEVEIKIDAELQEILIALLADEDYDSFWQEEDRFKAYILESHFNADSESYLKSLASKYRFTFNIGQLENQNWNATWESNFKPVKVDNYCYVKADFHEDYPVSKHTIVINPKMAFGTAHHETTYMMIQAMSRIELKDKKVVDFGCGTAILAILASLEEAKEIVAFDYDENAVLNSAENIQINDVQNIDLFQGDVEDMQKQHNVDVVLANINRSVLLSSRDAIHSSLTSGGVLLMSGVLQEDVELVLAHYGENNVFNCTQQISKGEWVCLQFEK